MICRIDCMTRLEAENAMARMREAISRVDGRITEHRLSDGKLAEFNFSVRGDRIEEFRDGLPEIAVYVENAVVPDRLGRREVRCFLTVELANAKLKPIRKLMS
jgi:hypothetical protein